jgi:colanic acid biosynthesis glycosyl transferase WcaI
MRILLLNLYFPPDTSATAKSADAIVRSLSQSHEVTVVCGRPSYDPTERRPWKLWQTEYFANTNSSSAFTVIRVGSTDYPRMQMKRRILNYLTYSKLASLRALFIPCDAIFAMSDPPFNGIAAAILAALKRKPLIYDIQDLYPDMAVAGSIVAPGMMTRVWEILHRWALRRAAHIIVLGDDMRARIAAKDIDPRKISIVRSGAEIPPAGSPSPPLNSEVIRAIRGNFRFVLLHAGNLGFYGAWDTLIAAARQLQNENIGLVFVGDGAELPRLKSLATGVTNIRFLPFFPSRDIPSVLAAPDAHIVTIKPGLEGVVVPSKMFGILSAGKPIVALASRETDVATLGTKYGFAIPADPANPGDLVSVIRTLAADPARVDSMGQAASSAANHFSRAVEMARLVGLCATFSQSGGDRQ